MDPVKNRNAADRAQQRAELLEAHVRVLAETIGERNVYHPQALSDTADYIERQWRALG